VHPVEGRGGFSGGGAGKPELRPVKRSVTLRQLLTHTAGYTYDIWNENTGRYEKEANLPGLITCKDDALKTPLAFDPGERWEYGINIDFAGKMVEKVSGQRLEGYFRDHIFGPLGMVDTSFSVSAGKIERFATSYWTDPATGALTLFDPAAGGQSPAGFIPGVEGFELDLGARRDLPVAIGHGIQDPVIPVEFGREARARLEQAGARVLYRESPMFHAIDPLFLRTLQGWLHEVI